MPRKRRAVEVFSLSFLDCICCGFGAVILFYTIISAQSGTERAEITKEMTAEVNRLEEEVREGRRNLVVLRNTLEKTESATASDAARVRQLVSALESRREAMSSYDESSLARREHIEQLKADIRALEESNRRLEGGAKDRGPPGQDISVFRPSGGERRYLTGLQLRGRRILILLDRSASMLHEDLVNVIVLRNSPDAQKRQAAKWRRGLDTARWLIARLPAGSQYQVYGFNTRAEAVVAASQGRWQNADDPLQRGASIEALSRLVPQEGTSLINAFSAAKALLPAPDQIVLITDGLPTQGRKAPSRRYIDAGARAGLFDESLAELPADATVDVVLLPMKGDLPAAYRFWSLATRTRGTLLMPSKDWP